jgi:ribose transport system ATP-binding protein
VPDEPTASLPAQDVQRLFDVLRQLRGDGISMIYVSHRLEEVTALCDRAAIMRDGKLVTVVDARTTDEATLVHHIIGKHVVGERTVPTTTGSVQLKVSGLRAAFAGPVDFELRAGEILGLVGLRGGGQDLIGRAIFGAFPRSAGVTEICGLVTEPSNPCEAIRAGIGFVGGERIDENLGRGMNLAENMFLNPSLDGALFRRLDHASENASACDLIKALDIRPAAPHALIEDLSGGNQQKVVLARWMHANKPVLILEEPTAGVDIGAKTEIYRLLRRMAQDGAAIIIVSTDFEEIAHLCGRCLVFVHGTIVDELAGEAITPASLLASASGSDDARQDTKRAMTRQEERV